MKKKLWDDVLFEIYKNEDNYDKVVFQLNKIRSLMIESVKGFERLSINKQFHICHTAALISISSTTQQVNQLRTFSKKDVSENIKRHSLLEGFSEPEFLSISNSLIKL